jgi:hypothetical protein
MPKQIIISTEDIVSVLRRDLVPLIDADYCVPTLLEESINLINGSSTDVLLEDSVNNLFNSAAVNRAEDRVVYSRAFLTFCMALSSRLERTGWELNSGQPLKFKQMLGDDLVLVPATIGI